MSAALAEAPELVHALPGRVRVHLPGWTGQGQRALESRLRREPGVRAVRANPLTANVVVQFDPTTTDSGSILTRLQALVSDVLRAPEEPPSPPVLHERRGTTRRARVAVRGLDRNPNVARHLVERLCDLPGVTRVTASALTGRVLVEYDEHLCDIEDLLNHVANVELPDLPDEDRPAHPLAPSPLLQGAVRTGGAALGLGLIGAQQLTGVRVQPELQAGALRVSAVIGILQSFPFVRNGLRRLLSRDVADVLIFVPGVISLTLAGIPLGLAVVGLESLRLLTECSARRAAWRRYEERLEGAPAAHPGGVIRLESGERKPRAATGVDGTGT